tara:strand:- start:20899 stop:21228 length:330 start_codon:yes stop_codon:yes gene_type:complete
MSSSIKQIAEDLKAVKTVPMKIQTNNTKSIIKNNDDVPIFFKELKEELKSKSYNNNSTSYLDEEISEVLTHIKTKGKIPIASLVSHIIEEWIKNNQEHIESLPTNKYLK